MAERNENRLWLRRTHAAFLVLNAIGLLATGPAFGALVNIKLSPPLANDEDVADFKTSPDGQWVVFRAGRIDPDPSDDDEEESMNLYSVPVEGGTPILLNSLLPPGSTVGLEVPR